jgi:TonB family protein
MAGYYRQAIIKPDPPLEQTYPDSLQAQGIGGRVVLQIRVNEAGEPTAIQKIEGVHPTLDMLAMQAATKLRWTRPWVVTGNAGGRHVPSWTRLAITY